MTKSLKFGFLKDKTNNIDTKQKPQVNLVTIFVTFTLCEY